MELKWKERDREEEGGRGREGIEKKRGRKEESKKE